MAENLRNENYADGTPIPTQPYPILWSQLTSGAQVVYSDIYILEATSLEPYGRLYNWYAVTDSRGLCPTGWHVPTEEDWTALFTMLGGPSAAITKLMASSTDDPAWTGTNTSQFGALPGGQRSSAGGFRWGQTHGFYWSSSPNSHALEIWDNFNPLFDPDHFKTTGMSVRCLRD